MMLGIVSTGETKNMLNFFEVSTGKNVCIMKSDFIDAVHRLRLWREHQYADNFSNQLFCLFCKADMNNKRKFFEGFPAEMTVYLLWYHSHSEEEFFNQWGNITFDDPAENIPLIKNPVDPEGDQCNL